MNGSGPDYTTIYESRKDHAGYRGVSIGYDTFGPCVAGRVWAYYTGEAESRVVEGVLAGGTKARFDPDKARPILFPQINPKPSDVGEALAACFRATKT